MRCLCECVCVFVTFVYSVKTNKHIFELFSPSGSQAIHTKRDGDIPTGNPLMGVAGGVGRNRDSETISGFCPLLTLQQARCCQHGRRWTTATVLQVMTLSLVVFCGYAGIRSPSATRDNQSPSPWFYNAKPTKRAVSLYTITVDRESCV